MEGLGVLVENGRFQEKFQEQKQQQMRLPRKPVVFLVFLLELFSMKVWWQEALHLITRADGCFS